MEKLKSILKNEKLLFITILLIGIFFRCFLFNTVPGDYFVDEASIGYEAWCLDNYGVDRNLNSYPINFIAWGSGQNAPYAYIIIPFIKILGLNIFAVRLPNLIFGILSMLLMYLVVNKIFNNKKLALLSMLMLAIMPWHIMISRWALESNILPFFFLLGTYFLLKIETNRLRYIYLSVVTYAFCIYTYSTSYFFIPLFLLLILPYLIKVKKVEIKHIIVAILLFMLLISPIILMVVINTFDLEEVTILNVTIPKYITTEKRIETVMNESGGILGNFIELFYCIILQDDAHPQNTIPLVGQYYLTAIPFLIYGIVFLKKKLVENKNIIVLFSWLIATILMGIVVSVNVNRINVIWFLFNILVSIGVYELAKKDKFIKILVIIVYIIDVLLFSCLYYGYRYKDTREETFNTGFKEALQYAEGIKINEEVYISNYTTYLYQPYIYILFENPISPYEFNKKIKFYDLNERSQFTVAKEFEHYKFYVPSEAKNIYVSENVYVVNKKILNRDINKMYITKNEMGEMQEFGEFIVFKVNK